MLGFRCVILPLLVVLDSLTTILYLVCQFANQPSIPNMSDLYFIEDSVAGPDVIVGIVSKMDKGSPLQMDAKLPMETSEMVMQLAVDVCNAPSETLYKTVDRFVGKW